MAVDITTLAIAVTSTGIELAARNLEALSKAASTVEGKSNTLKAAFGGLSSSQAASVANIEKLLQKMQKQSDLLGATTAATNAYTAAEKGATELQQLKASMLGASVDAFRNLAKSQTEAARLNKELDSSYAALSRQADAYYASLAKAQNAGNTLNQAGERAEQYKKLGLAQAEAIRMNNEIDASNKRLATDQGKAIIEDKARAYRKLAADQAEALAMNKRLSTTATQNTKEAEDFVRTLKRQADQIGMTHTQMKEYNAELLRAKAAQLGVTQQTEAHITALKNAKGPHESFNLLTAGSARELMVLGHELSQGSFQRFGGSLIVLAERVNFLPSLLEKAAEAASSMGMGLGVFVTAALAAVAAIALFITALIKGGNEFRAFNNSLTLTGNFAGTTGIALNEMAHRAVAAGGSLIEAKHAVLELANSGKFTADQIDKITRAAVEMEHATGKSVSSTVKEFEELATLSVNSTSRSTNAISQHLMKLNDHYHFLTAEQFNQVSMLEKAGEAQAAASKAEDFYADAMLKRSEKIKTELGYLSIAWHAVKEAAGSAWDAMLHLGAPEDPLEQQKQKIIDLKNVIATMDARPNWISGNGQGGGAQKQFDEGRLRIVKALSEAQIELAKTEYAAYEQGTKAQKEQESMHAQSRERVIRETYDRHQKAARELAEFDKDWEVASEEYKTQNLAGHLLAREAMVKRSQETVAKIKGIGLSGLDEANKEIDSVMQVAQRGYDNEIRLIEQKRHFKQISETDAMTEKDAILQKEYQVVTAAYEAEIKNAENFHSSDVRLMNDAQIKKYELLEKLGKFQSDNALKVQENASKEVKAANATEIAAQQAYDSQSKTLEREIDALQDKHAAYTALPDAIKKVGVSEKQMQDLITQSAIERLELSKLEDTLGEAEIKRIDNIIKKLKEKRDAQVAVELDQKTNTEALGGPARLKAAAAESANLWKESGSEIEKALTSAFDNAGKAAGAMFKAFADGQAMQIELSEKVREAKLRETAGGAKETELINRLQAKSAQARIHDYGNMAAAAKGFFKEGSTGYKVLEAAEKAFRIAEIAGMAMSVVKTISTEAAKNIAKIPGVIMSFMDYLGPWGAPAAAIAIAAVLGGGGGGGAPASAQQRQETQGTGSLLGSNDKSDSIAHSLSIMEKNSGLGLAQGSQMVMYLRDLATGISSLSQMIVRTTGLTGTPTNPVTPQGFAAKFTDKFDVIFGGIGGRVTDKIMKTIFGGKISLMDVGITNTKASLGQIGASGLNVGQYTDTKKDGGWFRSDKYSTSIQTLGAETNDQFGKVIKSMSDTLIEASKELGIGGDAFTEHLKTFIVDIGKISLKGMTGEEIQKAIEAVFSKLGDDMAKFAITGLDKFQAVGEGYLETVVRITNDLMQVKDVFAVLDKSFALTGLSAINVSESLIAAAGGLEKLTNGTKYFVDNFLTEAEKMGPITESVAKRLKELNITDVTTIDLFKKKVRALDLTNAADQALYAAMLELAPAFKEVADYSDKLADGTTELTKAQKAALDVINKARTNLQNAYKAESSALQSTIDKTKAYSQTLKDFQNSLKLGSNSPLTNQEKYAEARKQFDAISLAAKGGDAAAQQKFTSIATEFLNASKIINASGAGYTADFNAVQSMTSSLVDAALGQVDVATASLDALNQQVAGLIEIDKSVMSVTQAITELRLAIESGKAAGLDNVTMGVADPITGTTSTSTATDNTNILVAAIAALTQQVAQLQAAGGTTTGAVIGAIYDAAEMNADTVVEGVSSQSGSGGPTKYSVQLA